MDDLGHTGIRVSRRMHQGNSDARTDKTGPHAPGRQPAEPAGPARRSGGRWGRFRWSTLAGLWGLGAGLSAAPLTDAEVDHFNVRVGTQTFAGQYQFTTNTLLVETALAIQGLGSDLIKFYAGRDFPRQYRITLPASVTSLTTLARDEPSCRRVFDLPFRHLLVWAYCFSPGGDTYWANGMSTTERQREYDELNAFARYLLTTYSESGKSFYLGHWEGDWYLLPGYVVTNNPSATALQGMRDWLNTRQQAVDDAMRDTPHTNVHVYAYAEVNRVRDAMLNGTNSNQRLVNQVLPAVTNLDFVSWSSYDGQDLAPSELYRTLDYIESQLPTNKAAVIPGRRVLIGEYGWGGGFTSAAQEPRTRAYIRNLLSWGPRFILFWEIYNNEPDRSYWLIDSAGQSTPCYHLHARYINQARLQAARFRQEHGRLPDDAEFAAAMRPVLLTALQPPVSLIVSNGAASAVGPDTARLEATLVQGVYGDDQARVWLHWGRTDGGTNASAWEHAVDLGVNTRFGPVLFGTVISSLEPATRYSYRARAVNAGGEAWAAPSASFQTTPPAPRLSDVRVEAGTWSVSVGDDLAGTTAGGCRIQTTTNVAEPGGWLTVWTTNPAALPLAWVDPEPAVQPYRFYRVLLDP